MTFIAYALGASAINTTVDWALFWLGYALLFFLEVATVLTNDYFDFDSDRRNDNAGPFTGGSRMLVEQRLSFKQVQIATGVAITAAAGVFTLLITRGVSLAACVAIALLSVFALGYTVPPLKLSHRGFGEIDVALTHSAGVIAVGYFLQGGDWRELTPWLLSVPLFLAVFAAILLSGIPDHEADRAANKNTLVVKSGKKPALIIAVLSVLAAAVTATMFAIAGYSNAYGWGVFAIDVHAAYLVHKLLGHLRNHNPQRIDGLMVVALTYIIWFGALPLWHFAWSSASR